MDRRRFARRGLTVAAAAAGLVASLLVVSTVNADSAGETGNSPAANLEWGPCPAGAGADILECATVTVPLDYTKPDGEQIDIAISRLPSANPEERRGVLLTNPGGPGGPGLSLPADLMRLGMPASVLDTYDIIGMDPRGIGFSAPVSCGFTVEQSTTNLPPYAETDADVAAQGEVAKGIAEQCLEHDEAGTLRYMSTANTARDMDRIRIALGEEKVSYFGVSYGTVLGSAYVSLFPERTDRIVLDSNVGGSALDHEGFRRFGLGAEDRFPDFARYAAQRSGTYEIGATPEEVRTNFFDLADRLSRTPVQGIDGSLFRLYLFDALYADQQFPAMAQLWQALDRADAPEVRRLLETEQVPQVPQLYAAAAEPSPYDNLLSAQLAVVCNDAEWPDEVAAYQRDTAEDREEFPVFGGAAANITPCAFWPDPLEPAVEVTDKGPSNILLVQNLRDPATPHLGGELLREKLGDRARLLSVDQGGHGVYLFDDNPCGLNVTTAFLLRGERPATDHFCPASTKSGLRLDQTEAERRAATLQKLRQPWAG